MPCGGWVEHYEQQMH